MVIDVIAAVSLTVTLMLELEGQPSELTEVTVKPEDEVGLTVIAFVVEPLFQRKLAPVQFAEQLAVKVVLPP